MQGRKNFEAKLFYDTDLNELVPEDNFYRRIDENISFHFLYKSTAGYYGSEGQESIDPVVFFKILLVGYLNNTEMTFNIDQLSLVYLNVAPVFTIVKF